MNKIIVAGSRDFNDYEKLEFTLDFILEKYKDVEIVSGGCRGTDKLGERYAKENNIPLKIFKADWSIGKQAGYVRNNQMALYADVLIAFWDGKSKGTEMMIKLAKMYELDVLIVYIKERENNV